MIRTVLTLGTFDTYHAGHVALLTRCALLGRVVVGLNTDAFVARYKGRPPVIDYAGRAAVLADSRRVAAVVPNDQTDGSIRDVLGWVRPDVIVVGDDWQHRDYLGQLGITQADLDAIGCHVQFVPYTPGISSTMIRERIA